MFSLMLVAALTGQCYSESYSQATYSAGGSSYSQSYSQAQIVERVPVATIGPPPTVFQATPPATIRPTPQAAVIQSAPLIQTAPLMAVIPYESAAFVGRSYGFRERPARFEGRFRMRGRFTSRGGGFCAGGVCFP